MRFSARGIIALAFATAVSLSCAEDLVVNEIVNNPDNGPQNGTISYTAYVDGTDTKATLDGNVSKWRGDESIQIVGRNGSYRFEARVPNRSDVATFTYAGEGQFNETEVLAVYPYASGNYVGNLDDMKVSNVTVPSVQTAVAGSYDPNAAVAVAYTTDKTLRFKNAVALLKFTMGSSDVKNVTVSGEMSDVAGELPSFYREGNLYLTVHQDWKSDGARFAAYFWVEGGTSQWVSMTSVDGQTGMYTCAIPDGKDNVIFCRMNPSKSENKWNTGNETDGSQKYVWNQTVDLSLSSGNSFTIINPWDSDSEGKATGVWTTFSTTGKAGISGVGTLIYNDGEPYVTGTSEGYVSLNGNFKRGKTYYIAVAPVVFEKGFKMEFSNDGDYNKYEVKSTSKKVEFKRNVIYDLGTVYSGKERGFYTVPGAPDADEPCTIYYTPAEGDALYDETGDLYAHIWLSNPSGDSHGPDWGTNTDKYKMTLVGDKTWSLTMEPSIREWFDEVSPIETTPVQKIGILARTADKSKQTEDDYLTVTDTRYGVEEPEMPYGLKHGINYIDNSTVTLVLYDRDNQGRPHDFCRLLWDENWWGEASQPEMPLNYDDESGCWWITLTDLDPDRQYKFQYQLGYGSDVTVTTFDPYTEILYDRTNDQWISDYAYPGLAAEYGNTHYGRDNGFVSAFKINRDEYSWEIEDYQIEDDDDLVIYELLLRDFTDNAYGEGNLNAAMNYLDYIDGLGVNAIELMPVQEFEGNNSWGYGTHAYFAMDKVYGKRSTYKKFIDECHKRGMAVILDVVYNHATGAHPYAKLYWDDVDGKTASNNPWFNRDATHPYNVYHQWNHSNPMVREHVKRNLEYLIKEYKVDGFRFDLSKGFTQDSYKIESYNEERVGYLKEYRAHIRSVDPDAIMICEHFVDDENYELGNADIKVWRNMNEAYGESLMGWMGDKANFDGVQDINVDWLQFGTLVGYMESHDEERNMFKAQENGTETVKGDYKVRLKRAGLNAAFFLLVPGPKMIWQFGELGYDYSINYDGDRTAKKPWVTDSYLADANRKALYDTYASLLKFRFDNPRFFDGDADFRWGVSSSNYPGRYIFCTNTDGYGGTDTFALFGNFGSGSQSISITLPHDGKWYDYYSYDASVSTTEGVWNGSTHTATMEEGAFFLLVDDPSLCLSNR